MARETALPHHVQLRLSDTIAKAIDDWRRHQADIPTRSEAIRRLVEGGMAMEKVVADMQQRLSRDRQSRDAIRDGVSGARLPRSKDDVLADYDARIASLEDGLRQVGIEPL